jgi:hypothetical protein
LHENIFIFKLVLYVCAILKTGIVSGMGTCISDPIVLQRSSFDAPEIILYGYISIYVSLPLITIIFLGEGL